MIRQSGEHHRSARDASPRVRYSVMRVGQADFAYSDHDLYVRALGQAWDAGLVPEPRPSVAAADLRTELPRLRGIDIDLGDLRPDDVALRTRRFI
jgi:hypothetical protein